LKKKFEHVLFIQQVRKGKKDDYIDTHKKVWPDLLKAIKESGIDREIIWMFEDKIIIYMMSKDFDSSMQKLGETGIFKKWIEKMDPLLDIMQDYSGKGNIIRLDTIFDLEEQLGTLK
jgi:L-rhamnose mutarotase